MIDRITIKEHEGSFEVWLDDDEAEGVIGDMVGKGATFDEALTCAEDDLNSVLDEVQELRGLRPRSYPKLKDPPTEEYGLDEWAIVELFGHIRLAGRVSEVERFGGKMLRLDIPKPDGGWAATQFIGHTALYRVTPTTEDIARAAAAHSQPEPVQRWELEPPIPPPNPYEDMPTGYGGMAPLPQEPPAELPDVDGPSQDTEKDDGLPF